MSIDLRMRGLDAMYAFCVAVVLSLTVGALVLHHLNPNPNPDPDPNPTPNPNPNTRWARC